MCALSFDRDEGQEAIMRVMGHLFCVAVLASAGPASAASRSADLELAIAKCQVEVVRHLLEGGADVNAKDAQGEPITRWLASGRSGCTDADALEVAKLLDQHGARFERPAGKPGASVLVNLAPRRMPMTLAFLASKGAGNPTEALRAIAARDDLESVKVLLQAGASPIEGVALTSALMNAAAAGRTDSVAEMMKHVTDKQSPKVLAAYEGARRNGHEATAAVFTSAGLAAPTAPTKSPCEPRALIAQESRLLAQLGIQNASCKFIQECGDQMLIDCNSAADGPAYYIDRRASKVLATCGGACMRGCTGCPPAGWTCECHR
jgi:hypothetical protein